MIFPVLTVTMSDPKPNFTGTKIGRMPAQSSLNVNQTHVAGASWLSSHGVKLKIHLEDPVNKLSGRTAVVNSSCCEWDWKADLEAVEF